MEESSEGHSEDNKSVPEPESNKKRIVKSRAQVEALEKFYEEHKYPSETRKAEFAESVGLTEKQVSGWFCHRRLKDKRMLNGQLTNGKQDRSSGVIQDRGSGLKQDSCGSTKQGGDRNFDPREVESKRVISQEYAATGMNYEFGGHYTAQAGSHDDTASRSSSSEQNIPLHRDTDPLSMASSRSQTLSTPVEVKGDRVRVRSGPSGYLKVKGQVEHGAIIAVKRQLGKHYRLDGPPLAVDFDLIPLGAFESLMQEESDGPYYSEEASLPRSSDASLGHKKPHRAIGYDYDLKKNSHNSDVDGTRVKRAHVSDNSETYFQPKYKHKLTAATSYASESFSGKSLVMDMNEGSMIETPVFESRYPYERIEHARRKNPDSYYGQRNSSPYNARVNHLQEDTQPRHSYNDHIDTKGVNSEGFENNFPNSYEHLGDQQKGPSRQMTKEVKLFGERIAANDDFGSARAKVLSNDAFIAAKRAKNGMSQPHYRKSSPSEAPSWTNPANRTPRSAAEIPSSFSEDNDDDDDDETGGTSSSSY